MKNLLGGLGMIILVAAGCSNRIRAFSDIDPDYDLWTYHSFDWGQKVDIEKNKNPFYYNELNDKRIKTAVAQQLAARGYQLSAQPDLILHYHIIVEDRSVLVAEDYGYTYGPYWMRMNTNIYPYREGTLILDLMDAKTNHLVWRGWAVSVLEDHYNTKQVEKLIQSAVTRIFRKFPSRRDSTAPKAVALN